MNNSSGQLSNRFAHGSLSLGAIMPCGHCHSNDLHIVRHNDYSATIAAVEHLQLPHKYQRLPSCKDKVERRGHSAHNVTKQLSTPSSTNKAENKHCKRLLSGLNCISCTRSQDFTRRLVGPRFCASDPSLICAYFHDFASMRMPNVHCTFTLKSARGAAFCVFAATRFAFPTASRSRATFRFCWCSSQSPGLACMPVEAAKVICAQSSL